MADSINITKRDRKRILKSGASVIQTRYVVNYRDPRTEKRKQFFFDRQKDAQAKRTEIAVQLETGICTEVRKTLTVREAVRLWLADRKGEVKERTFQGYEYTVGFIVGPLLLGTPEQRAEFTKTGAIPSGTRLVPMLGDVLLQELTSSTGYFLDRGASKPGRSIGKAAAVPSSTAISVAGSGCQR